MLTTAFLTWVTADTPIADGLASFEATRGGIRFVQPPDVAEWEAATGVWTEATDASPGGETKPVKVLACGTEESAFVEAVSTRIGFGNMQSRFAPEQIGANTEMAIAAAARVRENNLLNLIAEKCVKGLEYTTETLDYTRELITFLEYVVANYRQLHRLPESQSLTIILPAWCRQAIKADLAREQAHANDTTFNVLQIQPEQVDDIIRARGLEPIWHLDGQSSAVEGGKAQTFPSFSKGAYTIGSWLEKMVAYVFVEGSMQRLDGGRLDLGVVRDSTLDATNDYETFVEVFETVVSRGFANSGLQLILKGKPLGASAKTA